MLVAAASSAVARALGAGCQAAANVLAGQSLVLSLAAGLGFGACILVGAPTLFRWTGASGEVRDAATLFARVLFGGAAITFAAGMLDSVLRGEGNTRAVPASAAAAGAKSEGHGVQYPPGAIDRALGLLPAVGLERRQVGQTVGVAGRHVVEV